MAAGTFEDLEKMLDEQSFQEIPIKSLTKMELDGLAKAGVDITGPTVKVMIKDPPKSLKVADAAPQEAPAKPKISIDQLESPSNVKPSQEKIVIEDTPELPKYPTTPEDEQEYLRCTLGMKPFSRLYSFMGNNISVTFHTRSSERNYTLAAILRRIRTEYGMVNQDLINTIFMGFQFRLSVSKIRIADNTIELSELASSDYGTLSTEVTNLLTQLAPVVYRNACDKLMDFEKLVEALETKVSDENFYSQTGD